MPKRDHSFESPPDLMHSSPAQARKTVNKSPAEEDADWKELLSRFQLQMIPWAKDSGHLYETYSKAFISYHIIEMIIRLGKIKMSYRRPSLREMILLHIKTNYRQITQEIKSQILDLFEGGVRLDRQIFRQSRISEFTQAQGRTVFVPSYTTTASIFFLMKNIGGVQASLLKGFYGTSKTHSIILYSLLSNNIIDFKIKKTRSKNQNPKDIFSPFTEKITDFPKVFYLSLQTNTDSVQRVKNILFHQLTKIQAEAYSATMKSQLSNATIGDLSTFYTKFKISKTLTIDKINTIASQIRKTKYKAKQFQMQQFKKWNLERQKKLHQHELTKQNYSEQNQEIFSANLQGNAQIPILREQKQEKIMLQDINQQHQKDTCRRFENIILFQGILDQILRQSKFKIIAVSSINIELPQMQEINCKGEQVYLLNWVSYSLDSQNYFFQPYYQHDMLDFLIFKLISKGIIIQIPKEQSDSQDSILPGIQHQELTGQNKVQYIMTENEQNSSEAQPIISQQTQKTFKQSKEQRSLLQNSSATAQLQLEQLSKKYQLTSSLRNQIHKHLSSKAFLTHFSISIIINEFIAKNYRSQILFKISNSPQFQENNNLKIIISQIEELMQKYFHQQFQTFLNKQPEIAYIKSLILVGIQKYITKKKLINLNQEIQIDVDEILVSEESIQMIERCLNRNYFNVYVKNVHEIKKKYIKVFPTAKFILKKPHNIEKITDIIAKQTVGILSKFVKGSSVGKLVENIIVFAIDSCEECQFTRKRPAISSSQCNVGDETDLFIFKSLNEGNWRFMSLPKSNSKQSQQYLFLKSLQLEKIIKPLNEQSFLILPKGASGQDDEKSKAIDFILLGKKTNLIKIFAINVTIETRKDRIRAKFYNFLDSYSKFADKKQIDFQGTPIQLHFAVLKFEHVQIELEELKTQLDQKFKNSLVFERKSDYFVVKSEENESIMLKTVRIFNLGDVMLIQRQQSSEYIKIFESFHKKLLEDRNPKKHLKKTKND